MGRRLALETEIFCRAHQAAPKEGLPLAIDSDARGQGIVRRDKPAREAEAVARQAVGKRRDRGNDAGLDAFGRLEEFAALVDKGRARIFGRTLVQDERGRRRWWFAQLVNFFARVGKFRESQEELLFEFLALIGG